MPIYSYSTSNLSLTNGGRVSASTFGQGNAESVEITATGDMTIDGENSDGSPSGVTSGVGSGAVGDAGGVTIFTSNLTLTNGGIIDASTLGQGNAERVEITATGDMTFDGQGSQGFPSSTTSVVGSGAVGDAGGVTISTSNLSLTNGARVDASTFGQGNAGNVEISATGDITFDGETLQGLASGAYSLVNLSAEGNSGGININASSLTLTDGGVVSTNTGSKGNAGNVTINAKDIFISGEGLLGFSSGVFANALISDGNGGNINIFTEGLTIADGGAIEASNFDSSGNFDPGTGDPGNISIEANSINLTNQGRIEAATQSTTGVSGIINLQVAENITLQNNSFISARAFNNANGGNLNIDTAFIVAFPNGNNDIIANAQQGNGGNININAESLFGIRERLLNDSTNDINASSEFSLDGTVEITTPDINPVQGTTELPTNIVVPEQTTAQACQANRELAAQNELNITGKGGIPPAPELPLDSRNIFIDGETNNDPVIPKPIETSQGKIQPARGVKIAKSGDIILTAYRTNNSGERIPDRTYCNN